MTLEVLHRALVLLGRRARRKRAEVAAAAGLRVDFARIEAIAARLELADHRRLPRAACAPRMLRLAARLCALVAIVDLHRWFSTLVNRKERAKVPARLPGLRSRIGERAASAESQPTKELDVAPSPPAPDRGCHPRPAEIRDRGSR